jgi:DNA (cytosine-5)-methyltransferase 1
MDRAPMDSIELFTGAGGLALGTHLAGFHHLGLFEWNEDACETLRKNAKAQALRGLEGWRVHQVDVRMLGFDGMFGTGKVDLVAGGAPCQPFSIGGKHQAQDDTRNMIPEFVRAVRELQPRAFILENVKGLTRQSFSNYFEYIRLQLTYPTIPKKPDEDWTEHLHRLEKVHSGGRFKGLQYKVLSELLNAADYGVPQTRERVFIVGFRDGANLEWHFPKPTHSFAALMHDQWVTGNYWKKHNERPPKKVPRYAERWARGLIDAPLDGLKPWNTVRDAISNLPEPYVDRDAANVSNHRLNPGARVYPGHTGSPYDLPAKTLKAGVHGVPGGENMLAVDENTVRYFTVREAARLQTFPDSWSFEGSWSEVMRQLGNAVPVGLADVVARSVAAKLQTGDHQ